MTFHRPKTSRHTAAATLMLCCLHFQRAHSFMEVIPDPMIHFSIGAAAGATGAVAAYPFDYVKSQMQTEVGSKTYKNGADAFMKTVQKNPFDLYKGVGVQVAGIAPEKGIKLGVNDVLHTTFVTSMGGFPLWGQVLSGGVAGACQVVASSPLEVLKVGLQTSDMTFSEVWKEVGGFKGLFRGAEACILRDVLFTAVCFPLYAYWVDGDMNTFAAGALSGVIASFIATPPDLIKTRILSQDKLTKQKRQSTQQQRQMAMQGPPQQEQQLAMSSLLIQADSSAVAVAPPTLPATKPISTSSNNGDERNPFIVGQHIIEKEGASVLFNGVSERCIGAIPRFGTTMAVHDILEEIVSHAGWLSHSTML